MDLSSSFLHPFSPPHLTNVRIGRVRKERRYHVNITVLSSIELLTFFRTKEENGEILYKQQGLLKVTSFEISSFSTIKLLLTQFQLFFSPPNTTLLETSVEMH